MIKSLYTRVVLTFLFSIIGGTFITYGFSTWVYKDKLNQNLQMTLLHFGQDIVRIYETFPLREADSFVSEMQQLSSYHIRIYGQTGQFQSYGALNGHNAFDLTMKQVNDVLDGNVVEVNTNGIAPLVIGFPLKTEAGTKAMFVEPVTTASLSFLFKFLANSLIAGSLLMLIAAIFLVRPIKQLTKATRRIASGDFNIKLNIKQKGELGTLARSFEDMMHDLQQLEQMRREFVTNVSHEVQSPLTSISGYALALKHEDITDEDRRRYLTIIIDEAKRMSKMSDSLLKLSLLESQSQQLRLVKFSLDEQIRRVIVALQPQWSARNIRFELHLKAVHLYADHDLINQVWTNIIGNSIKFSIDDSVINISMKQDIKNVTIRISDAGIGISSEDQKRIFERFF